VHEGFISVGEDLSIRFANQVSEALLGRPRSDLVGKSLLEVLGPLEVAPFELALREAALQRAPGTFSAPLAGPPPRQFTFRVVPQIADGLSLFFDQE